MLCRVGNSDAVGFFFVFMCEYLSIVYTSRSRGGFFSSSFVLVRIDMKVQLCCVSFLLCDFFVMRLHFNQTIPKQNVFNWIKLTFIRQSNCICITMITTNDDRMRLIYDQEYFNCIHHPDFIWLSHLKMICLLCMRVHRMAYCRYLNQVASARNFKSQSW